MKVEMFHAFYEQIEEIQTTIIKVDPLVVENIDFEMKIDKNAIQLQKQPTINKTNDDVKYDSDFGDHFWQNDFDDNHGNEATSKKINNKIMRKF